MALTVPPDQREQSFLGHPVVTDLDHLDAHVAILGIPFGKPYRPAGMANPQSLGPAAVRAASRRIQIAPEHYDFDLGGPALDGRAVKIVDCGDAAADMNDHDAHYRNAEAAVRKIVATGAMPIIIGGDHGVPIPVFRGIEALGPITLVHVDAHLDWRDEVNGEREGYSSPIRRASELDHIGEIYQMGMRAVGSARIEEVEAAKDYGAHIYTAYDVHEHGIEKVLADIPDGQNYYLTIDADGVDPSVMPGTLALAPGGLDYLQMRKLIHGLVAKGRVVGMDIVEIAPVNDVNQLTCIAAGRMIVNLIGAAARANYFE
jgi:agmatinase